MLWQFLALIAKISAIVFIVGVVDAPATTIDATRNTVKIMS